MFKANRLLFYYATTPVHMGAGSAIGAIDNPIQREVHTEYPMFAGSGIKGALRHHFARAWGPGAADKRFVDRLFGPGPGESLHAGAVSFTDAQLVTLPVRTPRGAFVHVASALSLSRLTRLAEFAGVTVPWHVPEVAHGMALAARDALLLDGKLVLEAFEFDARVDSAEQIGMWLGQHALPAGSAHEYFADRLARDFVILNDADFAHFCRHSMVVEPHVRIDDVSGTASDGGLFFTENLPPESLLVGLVQASTERTPHRKDTETAEARLDRASDVLAALLKGTDDTSAGLDGCLVQLGGDATTGRGLVVIKAVSMEKEA